MKLFCPLPPTLLHQFKGKEADGAQSMREEAGRAVHLHHCGLCGPEGSPEGLEVWILDITLW